MRVENWAARLPASDDTKVQHFGVALTRFDDLLTQKSQKTQNFFKTLAESAENKKVTQIKQIFTDKFFEHELLELHELISVISVFSV